MGLSNDLISQFVKATKDSEPAKTETIMYGTIVYDGKPYVKLDGSDLLTPVSTTAKVEDGERVTVSIQNHTANVTGNISSPSASSNDVKDIADEISDFEIIIADKISTSEFNAQNAKIDNLVTDNITIKQTLTANEADISDLKADNVEINEKLTATDAEITKLETEKLNADIADIKYATITDLTATNATVHNLEATYGDINTLIFGSASGNVIQTSFANAVIAQLGDAQIKSAMIDSITASQITAGDIITNNVRVMSEDGSLIISDETIQISDESRVRVQIGKDATGDYSINVWDVAGNLMFSEGGITDSAIKDAIIRNDMVSDTANISASKLDIDSLFEEINGSTKTINSTKIYLDDKAQTLDVAFTSMTTDINDLSNTVSSQGTNIGVIQGQIASKIWQQDIDDKLQESSTDYSALQQEIDSISATVASHTTAIQNKAENSSVKTVSDKVTSLEADLSGFKSTVSHTYATQQYVEDIEIGGRNLIANSDFEYERTKDATSIMDRSVSVVSSYNLTSLVGKKLTLSYYLHSIGSRDTSLSTNTQTKTRFGMHGAVIWRDSTGAKSDKTSYPFIIYLTAANDDGRVCETITLNAPAGYDEIVSFAFAIQCYAKPASDNDETWKIGHPKLELGNKATDWTPAPEDMATAEEVENAQNSANAAQETAADAQGRIEVAESIIQQLSDCISMLVTDGNGTSLMTQTENGWTFSVASMQSAIDSASNGLNDLANDLGSTDATVKVLEQAIADLEETAEYVRIQVYENEPCIELGESDSDFKLMITNTRIMFKDGSNIPTYINTKGLVTQNIEVENELTQGGFVWKIHNGNLGLIWKGVSE